MTQFHNIESYAELKKIFNLAVTAKRSMEELGLDASVWARFCEAIQWRLDHRIPLATMNTINSGLML